MVHGLCCVLRPIVLAGWNRRAPVSAVLFLFCRLRCHSSCWTQPPTITHHCAVLVCKIERTIHHIESAINLNSHFLFRFCLTSGFWQYSLTSTQLLSFFFSYFAQSTVSIRERNFRQIFGKLHSRLGNSEFCPFRLSPIGTKVFAHCDQITPRSISTHFPIILVVPRYLLHSRSSITSYPRSVCVCELILRHFNNIANETSQD